MQAKIAQPWEIRQHWTLDEVFDTLDRMAQYADVATYHRPLPKAPPPRRQDDAWARADQLALGSKRPG